MKSIAAQETFQDLHFPLAGIDLSQGFGRQPNKSTDAGYARTTPIGINVRASDPRTSRNRGGQRAGLSKYINAQVSGTNLIQGLAMIVGVGYTAPGGGLQTSQSGRIVTLVAISNGTVKIADAGDTAWTSVTNGTSAFATTGVIQSAVNMQKMYFADGSNWKLYNPATNAVEAWTATAGTLPVDSAGNKPRLICTWRGRTVVSGLLKDPQNWFMSAVDSPGDFDYSPVSISRTQAVAGNNSTLGLIGDVVTGLIPFSDDILIFLGDSSIWMMRGDPMAGGQIDPVSTVLGGAWGQAWCKDPFGTVYFMSNKMGIYKLTPGSVPVRVSTPIDSLIEDLNSGTYTIRMLWDDRWQGFHVFVTKTASSAAATHYFYESGTGAWWQDEFATNNHNPLVCCYFDGNLPTDRVGLIGSWDGYVRYMDPDASKDDGVAIESEVWIGPLVTKNLDDLLVKDLQAVMGKDSGDVTFSVYVGETAEDALESEPVVTGTWEAGRNFNSMVRRSGYAVYVKISSANAWAMESIRVRLASQGKVRMRGK